MRTLFLSYLALFFSTMMLGQKSPIFNFNVGVWNIWHGGIDWTPDKDGWDIRMRIVEIIKDAKLDVILMQETYSSGDFIAAELISFIKKGRIRKIHPPRLFIRGNRVFVQIIT